MKQLMQKSLCLMLALMLSFCLISAAYASEALIGQKTKDGHTIVSVQYAYSETDTVYLYTSHQGLYEKFGWTFVEEVDTFLKPRMQRLYRLDLTDEKGVLNA